MLPRRFGLGALAAFLFLAAGCHRGATSDTSELDRGSSPAVVRVHWLGIKRSAAPTNAAAPFMAIGNLPETVRLKNQTLDKLAAFLRQEFLDLQPSSSNAQLSARLLRPLLDDLVQEEWYLEKHRNSTNKQGALAIAIRLDADRAAFWETNLALVAESANATDATKPFAAGSNSKRLSVTRFQNWTIVGLLAADDTLVRQLAAQAGSSPNPFGLTATNQWLNAGTLRADQTSSSQTLIGEADLELGAILTNSHWTKAPQDGWPRVQLLITGDGAHLRTAAELRFARPLQMKLDEWDVPTNLMTYPLASFTALRGIGPLLSSMSLWNELNVGDAPNQLYAWSTQGQGGATYFVLPHPNASNQVSRISEVLLEKCGPWLSEHELAMVRRSEAFNGLEWKGMPFLAPFLKSDGMDQDSFIFGGLMPPLEDPKPLPQDLLVQLAKSNLVAYSWELTGLKAEHWLFISQFFRSVSMRPQLPSESAGIPWLKASMPMLGNCATVVTKTEPDKLLFVRNSSIGLSAIEIQLLIDWLESPVFPKGLHTLADLPPNQQYGGDKLSR